MQPAGFNKKGLTVIELVIVLFILALFLCISLVSFHRYHKSMLLELAGKRIVESVSLAREYAVNERKVFVVDFSSGSLSVLRENREMVGKEYRFPERIVVKEKSEGFNPVIIQPDGTSKTAGFIKIADISGGRELKIVLHNITGRCFVEKDEY